MIINKIKLENFYSYKSVEIEFDKFSGINRIEGKNKDEGGSNGSGKSSLIEGISWVIFGQTLRKSTEDSMVNNDAKKGTYGKILINNSVEIVRGRRPSKLELFIDGKPFTKESAKETQKVINETLNVTYKVFAASFIFGQHNSMRFLSSSPEDKRLIMRNFLNLDDVFDKRIIVKKLKSDFNGEIKKYEALSKEYESDLAKSKNSLNQIKMDRDKYDFPDSVRNLTLPEIIKMEDDYKKLYQTYNELKSKISFDNSIISVNLNKINESYKNKSKTCNECGSKYIAYLSKEEFKKLSDETELLSSSVKKNSKKLESLEEKLKIKPPISKNDYIKFTEYRELCSKEKSIKSSIKDIESKISVFQENVIKNTRQYTIMKFWETAFSESGLVKYVIRSVLAYFNDRCNYYLSFLTKGNYRIVFDDSLNETIHIDNQKIYYISLSGGEKRKVNLAVMLGLQSLLDLVDTNKSNLIFLDEIARDLDAEGIDGLYILLQELKKSKTIFIITHNPYFNSLIEESESIKFVKKNRITKLVSKSNGNSKVK